MYENFISDFEHRYVYIIQIYPLLVKMKNFTMMFGCPDGTVSSTVVSRLATYLCSTDFSHTSDLLAKVSSGESIKCKSIKWWNKNLQHDENV